MRLKGLDLQSRKQNDDECLLPASIDTTGMKATADYYLHTDIFLMKIAWKKPYNRKPPIRKYIALPGLLLVRASRLIIIHKS